MALLRGQTPGGGSGTVTNIATAGLISGGPITTTGTITSSMNTARLVGRNTSGTGVFEEITLGTGLSFTGTTLNAAAAGTTFLDSVFRVQDNADPTKQIAFEASGITTGNTRTVTAVDYSGVDVLSNGALTATRIPYMTAAGLEDSANFIWDNTNSQLTLLGAGTAALPTIGIGAVDTGIYRQAANTLGFSTAGTLKFILDATSFRANNTGGGIVKFAAGTAGAPAFSWNGDTNTGIWNSAPDTIAFSASGATQFSISDAPAFFGNASFSVYIKATAGTAALPTYSFVGDTNTGFWSNSGDTIKWSTGGTQRGSIDTTAFTVTQDFKLGTAGNGIYVAEGTNATMGIATLVAGTVTVNTTKVTANSRIFLTRQTTAGTLGASVDVTARTAGTSFTITSNGSILDTSTVAWIIFEPA